jgi:hypothetical protein
MFGTNTEVGIRQFILVQTGTYQEQTLRPFETVITDNVIQRLESATHGGKNLGVAAIQGVAANVIRPQAQIEGNVNIANGWKSRRFRFLLKVLEKHPFMMGTTTQRIFSGYTDQCDASINHLDPEMRIYFNSETVVSEVVRDTPNGPVRHAVVTSANQIVAPVDYAMGANGMTNRPTSHLIRPEDIFSIGQSQQVVDNLNRTGVFKGNVSHVIDSRTMVGQGGEYKYSMRRDTSPTRYLSDTLGAFQHAVRESAMSLDSDSVSTGGLNLEGIYGEAQSYAANHDIQSNTFLAMLKDHAGYMEKGYITYRELCSLFPEAGRVGEVTHFSMDNGRSIRQVNHADQSFHWGGADQISIAASLLAQVIPAVMMDNFIRNISFGVTNGMGPGNYLLEIHDHSTRSVIDGVHMLPYLMEFERRLITDVLNTISMNNQIPFQISMASDLMGDSVIDIQLGGESVRRYVAPTFSDSLFSPVITRRDDLPGLISHDMLYLVNSIVNTGSNNVSVAQALANQPNYNVQPAQPAVINPQQGNSNDNAYFGLL